MAEKLSLQKSGLFIAKKVANLEQIYQDFTKYIVNFQKFLVTTGAHGTHTENYVACGGCKKTKATLRLIGDDVGWAMNKVTIKEALTKVTDSIQLQTRFHPFHQQIPQKEVVVLQSGISGNRKINVPGQDIMQRQQQSEM